MFDPYEWLAAHGGAGEWWFRWDVGPETVHMRFTALGRAWSCLGSPPTLSRHPPSILKDLTTTVQFQIQSGPNKARQSAAFNVDESLAILGDSWFSEVNIGRIRRSIADRKAYPMSEAEPPQEKSLSAQGQTKKARIAQRITPQLTNNWLDND